MILAIQIIILLLCAGVIWSMVSRFPYPSPLIRPFLRPQLRWPEAQIRHWIDAEAIDKGFFSFFSRDPERVIPQGGGLVAPADGVVNDIFERDGMTYVVIALSFWDVHVQRSPVEGVVRSVRRAGDTFMDWEWQDAAFLRNKRCPVQAVVRIRSAMGEVEVRLITSYAARRINVYLEEGESVAKGQRLGNITFGSTVVLAMPSGSRPAVEKGARVVGGESIIAETAGASDFDAVLAASGGLPS